VKIFSQNSLIPIQILNGFFIFYCATWAELKIQSKKIGLKIKCLAHSEDLKSAEIYRISYIQPLWAKNMQNLAEERLENR
jgi:hypothetical protein